MEAILWWKKTLLSSLPPSCSARPQITASSRRCPVGTWHPGEGRPAIPHLTGTHAYTHAHTHTKWLSVCLWESGIWSCTCTHSYSAWLSMDVPVRCTMCLCCIIIVCLWAGVVCQSPPGPSLLWLVLLKQQTAWAHTHTHTRTSSEQPWSQADRDRQRLGEVERTAWGCLQTRGNTPPSHRNSGVEAKNSNPPSAIQLCLPPVCHSAHQLLNCSSFFLFLFLPLHLFNNLYVLFFCSWIHQRHQSCIDKTNASAV